MGLDMYIYEISKPMLENRVYASNELCAMDCIYRTSEEVDDSVEEMLPYAASVKVSIPDIDLDKIIADYGLPANSMIDHFGSNVITVSGNGPDTYVQKEIPLKEINEKYTMIREEQCYVWHRRKVAQWRKDYDVQEIWHEILDDGSKDRFIENGGYYKLTDEDIDAFHNWVNEENDRAFGVPSKGAAFFYHESQ